MPSPAPPTASPCASRLRPAALAVVAVLLGMGVSGCCLLDDTCALTDFEANTGDGDLGERVAAVATDGCPIDAITTRGEVRCAECDDLGAICGIPEEAFCEQRENGVGERCQRCVTDAGVVLYDDCVTGAAERDAAAFCEESQGFDTAEVCTTCYDAQGLAVSTSCGPAADRCVEETRGNQTCEVCFAGDDVVSTTCDIADIDPRRCLAYGDETGRCVDCFDDGDALVSHTCTGGLGVGTAVVCEESVQPEGFACTICYDAQGFPVDQFCDDDIPQFERCEQLSFSEQVCVVCLDGSDAVTYVSCALTSCDPESPALVAACRADSDCAAGQVCFDGECTTSNDGGEAGRPAPEPDPLPGCDAPPACRMSTDADGQVCRTCPVGTDGAVETRCIAPSNLQCEVLPESELPAANAGAEEDPAGAPPPEDQGRLCVLCRDRQSGVEVYRDCEGNGAVPPPVCADTTADTGEVCSVCRDAISGDVVYSSCSEDRCFDVAEAVLVDRNQAPLEFGGDTAVAVCKQCDDGAALTTSCSLPALCDDAFSDSFARCSDQTVRITVTPRVCDNRWDGYRQGTTRRADLQALMAYALDTHRLVIQAATSTPTGPVACDVDDCSCERGDVIELVINAGDEGLAAEAFAR